MRSFEDDFQSLKAYLKYERRLSDNTLESYESDIRKYFEFCQSNDYEIDQSISVRMWMIDLVEHNFKETSVNRKISSLNTFFKFLMTQDKINQSPMEQIISLNTPKKIPNYIIHEDIDKLLNQLGEMKDSKDFRKFRDYLIIELFYGTGLRRSELINLKTSAFDTEGRTLKVLGKGNKERIVPLHQQLNASMNLYRQNFIPAQQEFFFLTEKGKKLYPKLVYRIVKSKLSIISTQKKRSPHVLRHSFATEMLNKGAELNTIKDILGHSSLAATQIYTHNSIEHLKKQYNKAFSKINEK